MAVAARYAGPSLDGPYFSHAAHQFIGPAGLHVYADRGLQAGPWQLLWFYLFGASLAFAMVSGAAVAVGLFAAVRYVRRRHGLGDDLKLEAAVLALAFGWGLISSTYDGGHPAELIVPCLWALATLRARDGRAVAAGLAIGLACGWETWALLGIPVLLLAPRRRQSAEAVVIAALVAVATYLPFVVVGPFHMGSAAWPVSRATLVHAVVPQLTQFSWSGRFVQAAVVTAVVTATVIAARRQRVPAVTLAWLLPVVVAMAKIATDPQPRDYYWAPVTAALLIGVAASARVRLRRTLCSLPALAISLIAPLQIWPVELVALALVVAAATLPEASVARALVAARTPHPAEAAA